MIMEQPYPMEFIDQGETVILRLEEYDLVRTIQMGGDAPDGSATLLGSSLGRWEGDTLVVTTINIDWYYFNQMGVGQSPDAAIEERFSPSSDGSRLNYQLTITDAVTFTEPVTLEKFWLWRPDVEILEFDCTVMG
jgi:hypothetical protein